MIPVCHEPLTQVQRRNLFVLLAIRATRGRPATAREFVDEAGLNSPYSHVNAYSNLVRKGCLDDGVTTTARSRIASGYILALPGADGVRLTALSPAEGRQLVERLTRKGAKR